MPNCKPSTHRAVEGILRVHLIPFFGSRSIDTITVEVGPMQGVVMDAAVANGVNLRKVGDTRIGISLDEQTRAETIEAVWRAFGIEKEDDSEANREYRLPEHALRDSPYLTHPIFHKNRAEAEITRYMRRLADRDLALVYFSNSDEGMRLLRPIVTALTGTDLQPAIDHLSYPNLGD